MNICDDVDLDTIQQRYEEFKMSFVQLLSFFGFWYYLQCGTFKTHEHEHVSEIRKKKKLKHVGMTANLEYLQSEVFNVNKYINQVSVTLEFL